MVMANPPPQANPQAQANPPPEAHLVDPQEAQNIGREFVRQYYTLMNEKPDQLHRFYSAKSSFVHGGVERPGEENIPVCGQLAIHQKIMALKFNDCHAKIRQVDSHPTLGSGVVVQVSGELSNNGEAMRRFMQTFVLAAKTARLYYVFNDIFRYQDEVFLDEEDAEGDDDDAVESAQDGTGPTADPVQQVQENRPYFDSEAEGLSNGAVLEEDIQPAPENVQQPSKGPETQVLESDVDSLVTEQEPDIEKVEQEPVSPEKPEPETVEAPKTCSWAAMASKNTSSVVGTSQSVPAFNAASQVKPNRPVETKSTESGAVSGPVAGGNAQPQRITRNVRETRMERDRSNTSRGEEGDGDGAAARRGGGIGNKYPDNHQLFVGNLPHNISERELKVFFERWGKVLELRINTKSGGGKLPNFGFVVFDNPAPVQKILQEKPIHFNGEQRLNVEEKKARGSAGHPSTRGSRGGGGGPRGGYSNRGGMKNGNYSRPSDGDRRGAMTGNSRGGMSGPPRR